MNDLDNKFVFKALSTCHFANISKIFQKKAIKNNLKTSCEKE